MVHYIVFLTAVFGIVIPSLYVNAESLTVTMPESCKKENKNFCFENTNYPSDIVEAVLSDLKNFELAKEDEVGTVQYADREGDPDEDDCAASSTNKPIYYVVDENGRDRVVIQKEGKFEQKNDVTECKTRGPLTSRTRHFLTTTVTENQMSCENKYTNYDFLVLSLESDQDGKWKMDRVSVKIPVCCVCRYIKQDS